MTQLNILIGSYKGRPMTKYIWQQKNWPKFVWDETKIINTLAQARKAQGQLIAFAGEIGLEIQAQIISADAQETSAIEGEKLDLASIRSSVLRRLGIETNFTSNNHRNIDGLVDMLIDATTNYSQPLTAKRLKGWQAGLFPTGYSSIHEVKVGEWRSSKETMQVISGQIGKAKVHFIAPPSDQIKNEMDEFIAWFNSKINKQDGLIRAAIAHLWFITIHPFEDGNGRVARAITDLALAQDEANQKRCYSLSVQISQQRKEYYQILEKSQKGNLDITDWILWFLKVFIKAIEKSKTTIQKVKLINNFWKNQVATELNARQKKVLQKMLECEPEGFIGGMTNKKYVSIAKVSPATAKRDLADLVKKKLLKKNESKGRSVSYSLVLR